MPAVPLVPVARCFAENEAVALAGFLAGYRGSTREAYALDLRQFAVWCATHERGLFEVHRVDIECFGRELEARGRAQATIARRLCTIAGFYRYAEEEGLVAHSPAIHVRRPRLDYESHASGLDRNELGALLVTAGAVALTLTAAAPVSYPAAGASYPAAGTAARRAARGAAAPPLQRGLGSRAALDATL
jgi:integrase